MGICSVSTVKGTYGDGKYTNLGGIRETKTAIYRGSAGRVEGVLDSIRDERQHVVRGCRISQFQLASLPLQEGL